ncbi:ATP-binding protein [Acidiferrobacter sp.]|jgi:predicted AAA+ superfamily ATPase|uniref:ATP-binding protein n=1 Tax=Acidiferrobacter sp. TaxID=1872107 RepID=UPI002634EB77|nr:ATP-binding protein [Acidiferrobacter sp.]
MVAYLPRTIEPILRKAAREFPAIVLTGPRQSGKTTLLRHIFGRRAHYVSLESPDTRAVATADPRGFLDAWQSPLILDEIQYAPNLLSYIKERIDARRALKGQYFLSGSQNLLLMHQVAETLAGRAAVLYLLPLSRRELVGAPKALPPWEGKTSARPVPKKRYDFWAAAVRGGFPEPATEPARDVALWYGSYVQTYLERDVRTLRQVGDLTQFQIFLRTLAARSAQLINFADMGRDLGLATNTVRAWISVLEATHQIVILRPYFANIGKRLVKTPKVYFTDTGMLCYFVGIRDTAHAALSPMAGAIAESAVVSEVLKMFFHRGLEPRFYFWRTATGDEVDLVIETATGLLPLEIKATATPSPIMARGIFRFREWVREARADGLVVHTGRVRTPLGGGVLALPFEDL